MCGEGRAVGGDGDDAPVLNDLLNCLPQSRGNRREGAFPIPEITLQVSGSHPGALHTSHSLTPL